MKVGKSKDVMGEILISLISYTLTHFKTDFDSGKATISLEVMNFLKDWLTKHINGTDKNYTKCFNDHGLK